MEKWTGKLAVVTGASAGIGEAIVKDFARNGINVVGLARRKEKVEKIADSLVGASGKIYARECDVSSLESIEAAFKWIEEKFEVINILINNAGIANNTRILDAGSDVAAKLNAVVDTNLTGLVHCTRAAFRLMEKTDDYGLIININSVLGHVIPFSPEARLNLYPPSKHAVKAVSEVLRHELIVKKKDKIRVSNLSPGLVKTDIVVSAGYAEKQDDYYGASPHLQSEDISQSVMFLLQVPYNVNITELIIKPVGERI